MSDPILHWMPRVKQDIDRCLNFIARQPWGRPDDREADIYRGIAAACAHPKLNRAEVRRPDTGLWLRCCRAAQFVIVYAYIEARDQSLPSVVSIRAVRHVREKDVFAGVKEPSTAAPYGAGRPVTP